MCAPAKLECDVSKPTVCSALICERAFSPQEMTCVTLQCQKELRPIEHCRVIRMALSPAGPAQMQGTAAQPFSGYPFKSAYTHRYSDQAAIFVSIMPEVSAPCCRPAPVHTLALSGC